MKNALLGLAFVASASACSGTARGLVAYRADTQTLLDTRSAQVASCYNDALKADAKLAGSVTVHFLVEKSSGAITRVEVDPLKSAASPILNDCVVKAVVGLKLDPADRNEGQATFVYEFKTATMAPSS